MVDKFKKKILNISKLIGEPVIVRIGVRNHKVEILNVIKCFGEEDEDETSVRPDTHIDISKLMTYIG